jgi:tight adherence protein B
VNRRALALAGVIAALAAPAAGAATKPLQIVRVDTSRLPLVSATVKAPTAFAKSAAPAFTVRENGKPVSGLQVADPNSSAQIAEIIDASRSMKGKPLAKALVAARTFAAEKRPNDELTVLSFGDTVSAAIPMTSDSTSLDASLRNITVAKKEGTALYDGLLDGIDALGAPGSSRHILVVLTDGADTASTATASQIIAAAHEDDVTVYAIALRSPTFKPKALRQITDATGGALFQARPGEIGAVYAHIAADLHRTYVLEYTSSLPAKKLSLEISAPGVAAAAASFAAAQPILVAAPKASTVTSLSSHAFSGLLLAAGVGAVVLLVALLLFRPSSQRRLEERLGGYAQVIEKRVEESTGPRSPLLERLFAGTDGLMNRLKYWDKLGRMIQQADIEIKPVELFYIQVGVAAVAGILSTFLGAPTILALILFLVGLYAPYFWLKRKAKKRLAAFEGMLADTLIAIAASLRAGHSFAQAVATIVKDGGEPMAKEFGRVEAETRLGRGTDEAMQDMADRMGSKNFEFVVLAVTIQRTVGGSLSDILDMVADTVRAREQFRRKVKALTAMGRASAYVLCAMPFAIGVILELMSQKYMRPLLFTSLGHILIGIGIVSITLGAVVLRKIVNFRY